MPTNTPNPSLQSRQSEQPVVEVKFWQIAGLQPGNRLFNTLSAYSLDHGPFLKGIYDAQQVSFRFMSTDWSKTIKPMVGANSIPFEVVAEFTTNIIEELMKKKVYVAEDDLDILFTVNKMLEDAGYSVLMAHCGKPLMEPYLPATDLFILDKRMPDVDGLDICRHLRSRAETKDVPVILMSASPNVEAQAKAAGVNAFLEKPFELKNLLTMVSKYTNASSGEL